MALIALLCTSCSSPTTSRPPIVAKSPPHPDAAIADAAEVAAIDDADEVATCSPFAWPYPGYDTGYGKPPEPGDDDCKECGRTSDQKAAEAFEGKPDGVCDVRARYDLQARVAAAPVAEPATSSPPAWNHKTEPQYRKLVHDALALTADEESRLAAVGFVVPARMTYSDYTAAYYDVHRAQLPVYVSADSIFQAIYASHDVLLDRLENAELGHRLDRALGAMHCMLAAVAADYPPQIARDLDVYLTIARRLFGGESVRAELGEDTDAIANPIIAKIIAHEEAGPVELFGRTRMLDTTAYTPRGHYAADEVRQRYFQGAMWLSRMELNLVSRDTRSSIPGIAPDRRETPEEALLAIALTDLAAKAGALDDFAAVDRAWTAFAGKREDVSIPDLIKLRQTAKIAKLDDPGAVDRLRASIGTGYRRTSNIFPNPNVANLPVIATLLGPRVTVDTSAVDALVGGRGDVHRPVEVAAMLGNDRARHYTAPQAAPLIATARTALAGVATAPDLYASWLLAIQKLADKPKGALPGFMASDAFADLRLDTVIAAYGQLRHNHVLIQAQTYDQGGCEIPDGYVEPALATYRALVDYAIRGRTVFAAIDPKDAIGGAAYYTRLEKTLRVLVAISTNELANRPLTTDEKRFLAMIVEMRETMAHTYTSSFPIATFDGWYLDLFVSHDAALHEGAFVADYATFDRNGTTGVHYLAAQNPRLAAFVVDTGGGPRVMVGPVAHAMTHTGPLASRLTDEDATTLAGDEPWAASYTVAAPAVPKFSLQYYRKLSTRRWRAAEPIDPVKDPGALAINTIRIEAPQPLGKMTIDLLDHHFTKIGSIAIDVNKARIDAPLPKTTAPVEAFRIHRGDFQMRIDVDLEGRANHSFAP